MSQAVVCPPKFAHFAGKGGTEMAKKTRITRGSSNVFADAGLPNPEQELLKAQFSRQICRIIKQRALVIAVW